MALAEQAKKNGVTFIENCRISKILVDHKKESVKAVATNKGTIECTYFVNCAGLWARELAQMCEIPVKVPIYAVANHVLTSKFDKNKKLEIPIIRDLDGRIYFRESFGKIYSGGYEKEAKPAYNHNLLPGFIYTFTMTFFLNKCNLQSHHQKETYMLTGTIFEFY